MKGDFMALFKKYLEAWKGLGSLKKVTKTSVPQPTCRGINSFVASAADDKKMMIILCL